MTSFFPPSPWVNCRQIEAWVDQLAQSYQILPMDHRALRESARLMHGRPDHLLEDAMLAATAVVHRLTVATRNTRDFRPFRVPLFNPFTAKWRGLKN